MKIRVNSIACGGAGGSEAMKSQRAAFRRRSLKVPVARPGKDASAVLFTIASQYLNGHTIVVDGGYLLATGTV